jgi:hypothetical protein
MHEPIGICSKCNNAYFAYSITNLEIEVFKIWQHTGNISKWRSYMVFVTTILVTKISLDLDIIVE